MHAFRLRYFTCGLDLRSKDVVIESGSWSRGTSKTNFVGLGLGPVTAGIGFGHGLAKSPCLC
jgi:hypothetical protein